MAVSSVSRNVISEITVPLVVFGCGAGSDSLAVLSSGGSGFCRRVVEPLDSSALGFERECLVLTIPNRELDQAGTKVQVRYFRCMQKLI